jgi:thiamine-monophosphate kinase
MTASSELVIGDPPTVASAGEHALIARIRARLPQPPDWLIAGPGDDAAIVAPVRNELQVVTTDACVEGVHFDRRFVPPSAAGHRAMAMNLSDLAAMGAEPRYALLSLLLPDALPLGDFDAILDGLLGEAARHQMPVAGGNITRSPGPLVIDVTAAGTVRPRRFLTRAGARAGDLVFVSGTIGAARAGLEMCRAGGGSAAADPAGPASRYLRPDARVRLGLLLGRRQAATACIDLSDGLADGARQLAHASALGIEIDAAALPIDAETRRWFESRGQDPVAAAVAGGDDYELLFTVSPKRAGRLRGVERLARGLALTRIGRMQKEPGVTLRREDGRVEDMPGGYEHFWR